MSDSWIRFLNSLPQFNSSPDPASLIRHLSENEADRVRFLFSLHLPEQFGGSFGRYPGQSSFLRNWVSERYLSCDNPIHCLDAACGSGEGSYELAGALLECGIDAARISVTGVTICPLEVFASAHASFPQDQLREELYRNYVGSVAGRGGLPEMKFVADDLRYRESPEQYRMIICNGILGGPLLHERIEVEGVLRKLAVSLHSGGILLAADRFHGGWKKILSRADLEAMLVNCGLVVLTVGEGVAGMKI
jgi:chemotaxis methyl-accepting protein methylase